jgi:hypothetical protein
MNELATSSQVIRSRTDIPPVFVLTDATPDRVISAGQRLRIVTIRGCQHFAATCGLNLSLL